MNPLPRFLGMALFVVLAVLTALLAAPLFQPRTVVVGDAAGMRISAARADSASPQPLNEVRPAMANVLSSRLVFGVSLVAVTLAGLLVFSLALKSPSAAPSELPLSAARQEMGALVRLAESSAAQGEELTRERDVRRRAEEDAQLKQELLAQSVDEKIRLGRDLHDGIIQSLYAVGLTLETMRPLLKSDAAQAERRLEEIRGNLNATIRDVRTYITGLAPDNLRRASFNRSIHTLFEQLRAGRTASIDVTVDDEASAALSAEQNIEALQIAREAISNALRHGGADRVTLRLHRGDGEVGLLIQDNGRGFDPANAPDGGRGLANMQARADRVGARLRVSGQPGQGVRVIVTFPSAPAP